MKTGAKRYVIIADDFTGSNDTGVQLKRRGLETDVVLEGGDAKNGCLVIDTESRGLSAAEAGKKVEQLLRGLDFSRYDYVIKKVDSTLRGNIAAEVKQVDALYRSELVIFAPALPDLGRTTVNGIHRINGTPITQTELAHDPQNPVREDNITSLLQSAYEEPVHAIRLEKIRQNSIDFSAGRVFTCDAVTNSDMQTIIDAARRTGKRTLWVGTAALADNLLEEETPSLPSLGVVASLSSVTKRQVEYAREAGTAVVAVPAALFFQNPEKKREYVDRVVSLLSQKHDAILCVASLLDAEAFRETEEAAAAQNRKGTDAGRLIQDAFGDMACEILDRAKVSGLFLTGGDTAIGFFRKAGARGSRILTEVTLGIPMMLLRGGRFDGMKVITKAGAFGKEDNIAYALRKLKETLS